MTCIGIIGVGKMENENEYEEVAKMLVRSDEWMIVAGIEAFEETQSQVAKETTQRIDVALDELEKMDKAKEMLEEELEKRVPEEEREDFEPEQPDLEEVFEVVEQLDDLI